MNIRLNPNNMTKHLNPTYDAKTEETIAIKCIDNINKTSIKDYFKLYPNYMDKLLNTRTCIDANITSDMSLPYISLALSEYYYSLGKWTTDDKNEICNKVMMIMAPAFSGDYSHLYSLCSESIWELLRKTHLLSEEDLVYLCMFVSFPETSIIDVISSLLNEKGYEDSVEMLFSVITSFFTTCMNLDIPDLIPPFS